MVLFLGVLLCLELVGASASPGITAPVLSPRSGIRGDRVRASGGGASAGGTVSLYWDSVQPWDGASGLLNQSTAEPDGNYIVGFTVQEPSTGEHTVWVKDDTTGETGGSVFRVNGEPDIIVPDEYTGIQAAIDAADPYDLVWVRPGTYTETLEIGKPLTIGNDRKGEVTIDGSGGVNVVSVTSSEVELINITIRNGEYGVRLHDADYTEVRQCRVEDCTRDGITGLDSGNVLIISCIIRFCENGVHLTYCDEAWIISDWISDNEDTGIVLQDSDEVWIGYSVCHLNKADGVYLSRTKECLIDEGSIGGNTETGVYIVDSTKTSICNSMIFTNNIGVYQTTSSECYISGTEVSHNYNGFQIEESDSVIINGKVNGNTDNGVTATGSTVKLRYCDISANAFGVDGFESIIDARNCWWGDTTGPYHATLNPTGLGDHIDTIQFDPWQATLHQPDALISDMGCQFTTRYWTAIYPSEEELKPLGTSPAMVSDWLASAYVTTKIKAYEEAKDTNPTYVDQATGNNLAASYGCVLSFGGPVVNPVVKYGELDTTTPGDRAPVKYMGSGGVNYFTQRDGTVIPGAELPDSAINNDQDMFIIERYVDSQGRTMTLCYGFGWQGTYAAGKYFQHEIIPDLQDFYYKWIIVKWMDTNMDGFVNTPDEDTYTVVSKGI